MTRRERLLLGVGFVILGLSAVALSLVASPDSWSIHGGWCILGLAPAVFVVVKACRSGFRPLLRDHFLMLTAAFGVYFLFGALLPVFGPAAEVRYAFSYYPVNQVDALRVDAVNGVGFGIALLAGFLDRGLLLSGAVRHISKVTSRIDPRTATVVFFMIGIPVSIHVLSVDLGVREGIVAGVWRLLAKLTLVAEFIAVAYRGRGERWMFLAGVVVALAEAGVGALLLSKTAVLLPLGMLAAGLAVRYRSRFVLPVAVVILGVAFVSLGGIVNFGRTNLPAELGTVRVVGTRLAVAREGLILTREGDARTRYHAWSRLSYLPAQTAALHFYDVGRGGDDLRLIPWLFVPRFIAPEKPSITQTSADFHTQITGGTGSSTGQGIFVSGYFNGGWFGLAFVAALCGWILAQTSGIAGVVLERRDALLFPLVLLGVYMAFRIDGHFVADYLGPFVFLLYLTGAGVFASSVLVRAGVKGP